ncbi:MAG TPA: hypothetical protein VK196_09330 [Magnetospirillum sp.]|nr:hypothetical protein [Magnetospirillum sp.]
MLGQALGISAFFTLSTHADALARDNRTHWDFTRPANFYKLDASKNKKICGSVLRALNTPANAKNVRDEMWMIRHSRVLLSNPLEINWNSIDTHDDEHVTEESNINIQGNNLLVRRDTGYLGGLPSQSISFAGEDASYDQLRTMIQRELSCFGACSQTIIILDNKALIAAVKNYDRKARVKVASLPNLKILCNFSAKRRFNTIQY